jgi:hypothetical protein
MFTKNCREAVRAMTFGRRKEFSYKKKLKIFLKLHLYFRFFKLYLRKNSITTCSNLWNVSS